MILTPRGLRVAGRYLPVATGRSLTADKREGDLATPIGAHRITGLFYRADRLARPAPWARAIGPGDLWSDAPEAPDYNTHVRAPYAPSHERLRRGDRLYDLILTTDWNWPDAEPGRGSAIFLHIWRKPRYPTAGCLAFRRDHLLWLIGRIRPGARVIVQP